jgi:broad specificity phosphatase PhoE
VIPELREVGVFCDVPEEQSALDVVGEEAMAAARDRFVAEQCWDAFPMSETSAVFRRRVVDAVEAVLANHLGPGHRIVVACHGGVIGAYFSELLGVKQDMFFRPAHASVHRIAVLGERRVVISLNETHQLVEGETNLVTH